MTTDANAPSRAAAPRPGVPLASSWPTPPWTMEEHFRRIEALGQSINGYVQFMCKVGSLKGTSAEAKEAAVAAFYERLVVLERQLGKIQEGLQLG